MADFSAPLGPPPPKVPAGWTARWNDQYSEWFYVNIYTKKSQWDKPTEPVYPQDGDDAPPPGPPPPGYDPGSAKPVVAEKTPAYGSNNPYGGGSGSVPSSPGAPVIGGGLPGQPDTSEDERLARQLQEQENAQSSSRGASDSYYGAGSGSGPQGQGQGDYAGGSYDSNQLPPREAKKGGFLSKLSSKLGSSGSHGRPPQQYAAGGVSPQPQRFGNSYQGPGGYGPQTGQYGGGYPPQQQYGGYYGGGPRYGGGYGQPQYGYGQPPRKSGGMGTGAAVGLGAAGGLVGGMLLGEAIADDGGDDGGDGGDDGGDGGDDG